MCFIMAIWLIASAITVSISIGVIMPRLSAHAQRYCSSARRHVVPLMVSNNGSTKLLYKLWTSNASEYTQCMYMYAYSKLLLTDQS